jgi:hypothetical protein
MLAHQPAYERAMPAAAPPLPDEKTVQPRHEFER